MKFSLPFSPPGHRRATHIRRGLAIVLVVAAVVTALLPQAGSDPSILVFARDMPVGAEVAAHDVRLRSLPEDAIPANAATDPQAAIGRVVVSGVGAGEIVTDARLTGPRLISALAESFPADIVPVVVPVRLADPATVALLRHGDTVTLVTPSDSSTARASPGLVVAAGGRVVIADPEHPETILIALGSQEAQAVASASLSTPLGVIVTGDSAN